MSEITLIEKIKKDAAEAVQEIKSAGSAEVESIQRAIEAEVETLKKQSELDLAKTKQHRELVAVSKAKQAGNIAIQSAKRHEIDDIITRLTEALANQDSAEYVAFFVTRAKGMLPDDTQVKEVRYPEKRQTETETIMSELGLTGTLTTDSSITAGVVIETEDGVYDLTLERIMGEKRSELEMIIVNAVMS